jgi:hypothetical protein
LASVDDIVSDGGVDGKRERKASLTGGVAGKRALSHTAIRYVDVQSGRQLQAVGEEEQ